MRDKFGIEVTPIVDTKSLHTIDIKPQLAESRVCKSLAQELREDWGEGRELGDRRVWVNPTTAQRAVFANDGGCALRFEKYTPVASWLARTPESIVPMWALGQPTAKLSATLDSASLSSFELAWSAIGVGVGSGTTQITADLRQGKVVSLVATIEADVTTQETIIVRVTELVGKEPAGETLVWKTNPPIEIRQDGARMVLTIGTRPQD
jgi:hypothetical protein